MRPSTAARSSRVLLGGALVALTLLLVVVVMVLAGTLLRGLRTPDLPVVLPDLVDPYAGAEVRGWPGTSRNEPGVYSWGRSGCATESCITGWIHNGYGSGDVSIDIEMAPPGTITDPGATAASVAGREGFYRRIDARQEQWVVEIEGHTVVIQIDARPGTSATDLAEAHAVIASMRAKPWDNALGFRLLFRLVTDDWDSG